MSEIVEMANRIERQGGVIGDAAREQNILMSILMSGAERSRYVAAHVQEAMKQDAQPRLVVAALAVESLARCEGLEKQLLEIAKALEAAGLLKIVKLGKDGKPVSEAPAVVAP